MTELLKSLVKLQDLELSDDKSQRAEKLKAELRAKIPGQILGHYDRLMARGKKGVIAVRNQTCTGCHMQVPLAVVMTLMSGTDIQLCDNCGRYLYLPQEEATEPVPSEKNPPAKRSRKKKEGGKV